LAVKIVATEGPWQAWLRARRVRDGKQRLGGEQVREVVVLLRKKEKFQIRRDFRFKERFVTGEK